MGLDRRRIVAVPQRREPASREPLDVQRHPGAVELQHLRRRPLIERELPDPDGLAGEAKAIALELRRQRRAVESRLFIEQLKAWAEQQTALPRSALAEALGYLLGNWNGLTAFLADPLIPLTNNRTERALRGVVLGRKNHYGSRSVRGTQVAAIMYSLIETCILCGVDPEEYLRSTARAALREPGVAILPQGFARGL